MGAANAAYVARELLKRIREVSVATESEKELGT